MKEETTNEEAQGNAQGNALPEDEASNKEATKEEAMIEALKARVRAFFGANPQSPFVAMAARRVIQEEAPGLPKADRFRIAYACAIEENARRKGIQIEVNPLVLTSTEVKKARLALRLAIADYSAAKRRFFADETRKEEFLRASDAMRSASAALFRSITAAQGSF